MAENVFAHTPLQNALGREAAAMEARKARGILPTTATTPPSEPLKSAPSAPEAPKTPRLVYEDASSRYGAQANLIRAVAEMAAKAKRERWVDETATALRAAVDGSHDPRNA